MDVYFSNSLMHVSLFYSIFVLQLNNKLYIPLFSLSIWYFMTGKDGDFYLNTTSGSIFKKINGYWVFIYNINHFPSGFTGNIKIGWRVTLHVKNGLIIGYSHG